MAKKKATKKRVSNKEEQGNAKRSRFSYLAKEKLDDLYYARFLKEIWTMVEIDEIKTYIQSFYKNPTPMEYVEIQELLSFIAKVKGEVIYKTDKKGIFVLDENGEKQVIGQRSTDEHDWKRYHARIERAFGKVKDVVELSGKDGGPISLSDMSKEDFEKYKSEQVIKLRDQLLKTKKEFGDD